MANIGRPGKDDECEISLHGIAARIPVIGSYGKALKKAMGITKFHYLSPENLDDRKLRGYGLIDFGLSWSGCKVFTIYGIKSDAADRDIIEARFKTWLGITVKKK